MLAHFKAGKTMSPKTAQHLGALILAIHQAAVAEGWTHDRTNFKR